MVNDIHHLLRTVYNYIHHYDGPLSQAVHFPHSPDSPLDLSSCAPHLIYHHKADSYVFRVFQPIKYIHLLLDGKCCVEKYNQSGQLFTDSTRDALQVFGLLETAVHGKFHTATMKCMTDCVIAKIPVPLYMQVIREDPELMMMSMQHICFLFLDNVANTDQLMLSSPRRSILVRMYQYCSEKTFPVTVQIRKEELAQDLNMNLRTLYRHLDKLYETGILSARKGKICISHAQYLKIEDELFNQAPQ